MRRHPMPAALLTAIVLASTTVGAQPAYDPVARIAAQTQVMKTLAWMDGVWRGPAWTILANGQKHEVTQTERIGPSLGGSIKVLEGRSYNADGTSGFNAFGVVSVNSKGDGSYILHSYAQGQAGDFQLKATPDGYVWEIPAGPVTIRYTAVLKDGVWTEIGEQIALGRDPAKFFQMTLHRVGDSPWPGVGAIPPR